MGRFHKHKKGAADVAGDAAARGTHAPSALAGDPAPLPARQAARGWDEVAAEAAAPFEDSPTRGLVAAAAAALAPTPSPDAAARRPTSAARHLSPEPVLLSAAPSFSVHGGAADPPPPAPTLSPARQPTSGESTPALTPPRPGTPPPPAAQSPPPPHLDFLYAAPSLHTTAPAAPLAGADGGDASSPPPTASSPLTSPGRSFTIVTTAALPWLTGTAVNPALRAAYLAAALPRSKVRLLLPWLSPADQARVFPPSLRFASPAAQQEWVRAWLADRMGLEGGGRCAGAGAGAGVAATSTPTTQPPSSSSHVPAFEFVWYQGRYDATLCSIFPYGNLIDLVPGPERDVAILEEPEHLTWYHHGPRWSDEFSLAVGVAHTNYVDYVRAAKGAAAARVLKAANAALVGAHCHRVVKLSGAVQRLPRQVTCFVHGVAPCFLREGVRAHGGGLTGATTAGAAATTTAGAYFLGKALVAKGWANLLALLDPACPDLPPGAAPPHVDGFGSGEDAAAIAESAAGAGAPLAMHPGVDHLSPALRKYRVFCNPSTSDVVATTSAEALAMGRWLVVPRHPCNAFFSGFAGCLVYDSPREFYACMERALASPPPPLSDEEARALTWQAATERFLAVIEGGLDAAAPTNGRYTRPSGPGVRRIPSEDAGSMSDGGLAPLGGGGTPLGDLPRGGSGAASAAALSALAPGEEGGGEDTASSGAYAAGSILHHHPPPTALGSGTGGGGGASADGVGGSYHPPPASPPAGVTRSASTLAFAPTPSPVKVGSAARRVLLHHNPVAALAARARRALGGLAYRAFEAASGVEAVRRIMGAGAFTRDAPPEPPGAFDPTDRAALADAVVGREAAADAHARLGYPRPRYVG